MTPDEKAVAAIVDGLTEAEKATIRFIGIDVKQAAEIDEAIGDRLFDLGLISQIFAVYYFTNLTPLGLAVRQALTAAGKGAEHG